MSTCVNQYAVNITAALFAHNANGEEIGICQTTNVAGTKICASCDFCLHRHQTTVEASNIDDYVDEGAVCWDFHDGTVSTGNPNANPNLQLTLSLVGDLYIDLSDNRNEAYELVYTCTNSHNATTVGRREVFVRDTICPTCTLNGPSAIKIEASFPFADPGASCIDAFSTVNKLVSDLVDVEHEGLYRITYSAVDEAGNNADGQACQLGEALPVRTVTVVDTLKPVIALQSMGKYLPLSSAPETSSVTGVENPSHAKMLSHFMAERQFTRSSVVIGLGVGLTAFALFSLRQQQRQRNALLGASDL
jgi:hypothetical protein